MKLRCELFYLYFIHSRISFRLKEYLKALCNPECINQMTLNKELIKNVDMIKFKEDIIKNHRIGINIIDQAFSSNNETVKMELKGNLTFQPFFYYL